MIFHLLHGTVTVRPRACVAGFVATWSPVRVKVRSWRRYRFPRDIMILLETDETNRPSPTSESS